MKMVFWPERILIYDGDKQSLYDDVMDFFSSDQKALTMSMPIRAVRKDENKALSKDNYDIISINDWIVIHNKQELSSLVK